ncbi:EAL domain-containing protein [Thauera mechernichensis]|uniref:EAL domain-containing protein n=1 Tax=Thauera sp. 27 TaxID=305700 RepID=UPI0002CFEAE3|nr:EAL domain-containing protein [Thauera sp. 27]ENO77988.1 PAS domain-containing protein/PAC sensor-containing diguanylate cyclase/phosphodiesterase [Thauera sp. 27]
METVRGTEGLCGFEGVGEADGSGEGPNGFELHYQSQVCADQRVQGLEALLRWNHPLHGQLRPVEFIHTLEKTGAIIPIGLWVLGQAGRQLDLWRGHETLGKATISINVSAVQVHAPHFASRFASRIEDGSIDPRRLVLELTESMPLVDLPQIEKQILQMKEMGAKVALDDVGSGYSALTYLRRLPVDQIKLDKEFIYGIEHNAKAHTIVNAVVGLAKDLDLEVVAEGVETDGQFCLLKEMGCDLFQGYLFDAPKPASAW